jgi:2-C-methyl-D-erythritol 2,4-cyclodiphosphate synthase
MRIGFGYDAHRLTGGRSLVLGGVEIPFDRGLEGWSDADVAIHAVIDSLLGAASLGDIGKHFPPNEPVYKDISSVILLERTGHLLGEQGWRVGNIDATIVAEHPHIQPYIDDMRQNISHALSADINSISIKATTSEGLGFTGQGEGIIAYSVALIEEISHD